MDNNEIARQLAVLGQREARLMAKLGKVQAERCALLQGVAQHVALAPDAQAEVVAPKDDGEG